MKKSNKPKSLNLNDRLALERSTQNKWNHDDNVIKTVYSPEGKVIYQLIRNNKNYYDRRLNKYSG